MRINNLRRKVAFLVVLLTTFTAVAAAGGTKAPGCLKPFVETFVEDEALAASDKNQFFGTVHKMDLKGQGGTVNAIALEDFALAPSDVFHITLAPNNPGFSHLYSDANSMMGAISDLTTVTNGAVTGPPGLVGELKVLSSNNFAGAAGVELDLKVGQDLGKANVVSFQKRITAPNGVTRIYDVESVCPGCSLGTMVHENKNWGSLLAVDATGAINDSRMADLAAQFQTDILIHGPGQFDSLHFNLRTTVQGQDQQILQALLKQFDDPAVVSAIGITQSAQLKTVFQSKWPSLVTYK
jgi:hypothetical protein